MEAGLKEEVHARYSAGIWTIWQVDPYEGDVFAEFTFDDVNKAADHLHKVLNVQGDIVAVDDGSSRVIADIFDEATMSVMAAARDQHTGAMIAYYIPPAVGQELAKLTAGLQTATEIISVEEMHLTIAYLGDIGKGQSLTEMRKRQLTELLQQAKPDPISATINGVGLFQTDEGICLYASVDSPELPTLRENIVNLVAQSGIELPLTHGFSPHITLAYLPASSKEHLKVVPNLPVTLSNLTLTWKGERTIISTNRNLSRITGGLAMSKPIIVLTPRALSEASVTNAKGGAYALQGTVIVEGLSANRNYYTEAALKSAPAVFAGKPIYADHPSITEEHDRPERSIHSLVGRLPDDPGDFWIESATKDHPTRLRFKNAVLSKTADWLATMIKEGIAGDMSINAMGSGDNGNDGAFNVQEFHDATSLDFVTTAAAGGVGELLESQRKQTFKDLTIKNLADERPDLLNSIAARERSKAYGGQQQIVRLREQQTASQREQAVMTRKYLRAAIDKASTRAALRVFNRGLLESQIATVVEREMAASDLPQAGRSRVLAQFEPTRQKLLQGQQRRTREQGPSGTMSVWSIEKGLSDAEYREFEQYLLSKGIDVNANESFIVWDEEYEAWRSETPYTVASNRRGTREQEPAEPGAIAPTAADLQPSDPPTIELPPDAAQLPEDAQALWLESYVTCLVDDTEEACMHKAWAAIADAGWKNEQGQWTMATPDIVPVADDGMATDVFTDEELAAARRHKRLYQSSMTGAQLFDLFVGGQATTADIAAMDLATVTRQVGELRQEDPAGDDIPMTNAEIAALILDYAHLDATEELAAARRRKRTRAVTGADLYKDWIVNAGLETDEVVAWTLEDWSSFVQAFLSEMGDDLEPVYANIPAEELAQMLYDHASKSKATMTSWKRPESRQGREAPEPLTLLDRARNHLRGLIAAERQYIASLIDANLVSGMGTSDGGAVVQAARETQALTTAFGRLGLTEEQATIAAGGRKR